MTSWIWIYINTVIRLDNLYLKSGQIQQKKKWDSYCPTINTCIHKSILHIKIHTRRRTHSYPQNAQSNKIHMYTVKIPVKIQQIWCMVFISPKLWYNSWKQWNVIISSFGSKRQKRKKRSHNLVKRMYRTFNGDTFCWFIVMMKKCS